jgi:RNA polymerase sigma factor (sigma-70 family)
MVGGRLHNLLRYLRRVAAPADSRAVTDSQLLERFVTAGDQDAFELLARRHAPMILGVCRRVLGDAHDAEDAFQATFLVLAKKAASAARHRSLGGWLYTVAQRVALRARARRAARATHEQPLKEPPPTGAPDPTGEAAWRDVRRVIDEEVSRLPEKYRVPFVLYHLEGRSNAEVARELGCPVGTVESWLTRARQKLRANLTRRGLAPVPGLLAALALQEGGLPKAAAARVALAASRAAAGTVSAEAAALADAVVRSLGLSRVKVVLAVVLLLAATVACAAGLAARRHPPAESLPRQQSHAVSRVRRYDPPRAGQVRAGEPIKLATLLGFDTNAIALTPYGKTLASGNKGATLELWDLEKLKKRDIFFQGTGLNPSEAPAAHGWQVNSVALSPDGKTLASGSTDNTVRLWDVATGKEKAILWNNVYVYSVVFSPDGKALAASGGFTPRGSDKAFREIAKHPEWSYLRKFEEIRKYGDWPKEIGEVKVWNLATRKARTFFHGETGRIRSVAFSPDGKTLAAGARDGAVRLWDVATGKERVCLREKNQYIQAVAFSPDGKTLAVAFDAERITTAAGQRIPADRVHLWDVASNRVRARLQGHAARVNAIAFSADGKTLATASTLSATTAPNTFVWTFTGEVRLWDPATGRLRGAPLICQHDARSVAFGARDTILAVGGWGGRGPDKSGEITLWKLRPNRGTAR